MEITKNNKFVEFMKNFGVYTIVGFIVFAVALTFALAAALNSSVPTSVETLSFKLPMANAVVVKDFSNTYLQKNETLNQWEAHLAIDLASSESDVYAVLGGEVTSVSYDYLTGNVITIKHSNGFESQYSSLANDPVVKVGDKVSAGEKIGETSQTASSELDLGNHLHFTLKLNNKYVDPNDYLDLQQK